jgi:hypothetical protein
VNRKFSIPVTICYEAVTRLLRSKRNSVPIYEGLRVTNAEKVHASPKQARSESNKPQQQNKQRRQFFKVNIFYFYLI